MPFLDYGPDYLHGGMKRTKVIRERTKENKEEANNGEPAEIKFEWRSNELGSIPCSPQQLGGCGDAFLELKCILPPNGVSELLKRAEELIRTHDIVDFHRSFEQSCSCLKSLNENVTNKLLKAASRPDSEDNFLYCPTARDLKDDDLKHLQYHWSKGEPVFVTNVLENTGFELASHGDVARPSADIKH